MTGKHDLAVLRMGGSISGSRSAVMAMTWWLVSRGPSPGRLRGLVLEAEVDRLTVLFDDYGYRELATQVVSGRHLLAPA